MEKFELLLAESKLRATCTKIIEKHPPSIMSMNITAIEDVVTVYTCDVTHKQGNVSHHSLVRDKNGHWQLNLLEDVDHKTNEELKKAIEHYESGAITY
jgi:hypothetical protein